jgi:hypothetical protein
MDLVMTEYDDSKSLTENAMKGVDITEYSISKQEREALERIKRNIQDETVSLEEIVWLQDHLEAIFIIKDVELAQWAGLDEQGFQKYDNYYDYCLAEERGEFDE